MSSNIDQRLSFAVQIVEKLRSKDGCPWDIEQTHQSLVPYLIEEAHELAEVLQELPQQDWKIKDELGDCLYQVLIHSQIASETGRFNIADVLHTLAEKLQRRHPHVFGGQGPWSKEEVLAQWQNIKQQEKQLQPVDLHPKIKDPYFKKNIAATALEDAHSIGVKAQQYRFDWSHWQDVLDKVVEELNEVKAVCSQTPLHTEHLQEEIGDLLFAICQLARVHNLDPEKALKDANQKFRNRFQAMIQELQMQIPEEKQILEKFKSLTAEEKEELWRTIKRQAPKNK